jgi:hypothetical protein
MRNYKAFSGEIRERLSYATWLIAQQTHAWTGYNPAKEKR